MAVDDVFFPLPLLVSSQGGPGFNTTVVRLRSGHQIRVQRWATPLRRYDVGVATTSDAAYSAIYNFFIARGGAARGFKLADPGQADATVVVRFENDELPMPSVRQSNPIVGGITLVELREAVPGA
ncbi:MAG: DUF2460 domain-containing protein [Pseudomonadota bacterium]